MQWALSTLAQKSVHTLGHMPALLYQKSISSGLCELKQLPAAHLQRDCQLFYRNQCAFFKNAGVQLIAKSG